MVESAISLAAEPEGALRRSEDRGAEVIRGHPGCECIAGSCGGGENRGQVLKRDKRAGMKSFGGS